ncbi:MAG: HprK-related kinase A [Parahaliea sp.]
MSRAVTPGCLSQLSGAEVRRRLRGRDGLRLQVGPYCYSIECVEPVVAAGLSRLYGDFPLAPRQGFVDFQVALRPTNVLQHLRHQLVFLFDEQQPFASIPASQAYAFLEWGMNWCLSTTMHEYLKLHAAVVAKQGLAVVMPGLPGAGKSTLCAALGLRGWQVLSDEHALIQPGTANVVPVNRPISLKNESIDVIRAFEPTAVLGPVSNDTHKGRVAHLKADLVPGSHDPTPVRAAFMLYPRYEARAALTLRSRRRAESFIFAAHHSFNYSALGEAGFEAMAHFTDAVESLDLRYSDLDQAITRLEALVAGSSGA